MIALCASFVAVVVATCGCNPEAPAFRGESAWGYLLDQCELGPRVPGSDAHAAVIRYMAAHLEARGATVRLQRFTVPDPYGEGSLILTNVIGSFNPERRSRVLVAAHFDSRPWADQEPSDSLAALPVPGANDGASGVAVLLEIADILATVPPPEVGVDIVLFDGEDYGKQNDLQWYLLGSKYFASNLAGYRPVCGVLLDMVGAKDARIRKEANSQQIAPALNDTLFARARALHLPMFVDSLGSPYLDDHIPLLQAGIPTVDLIGLPYAHWHRVTDTPDKCSQETLRQTGVLIRDFIYDFPLEALTSARATSAN